MLSDVNITMLVFGNTLFLSYNKIKIHIYVNIECRIKSHVQFNNVNNIVNSGFASTKPLTCSTNTWHNK